MAYKYKFVPLFCVSCENSYLKITNQYLSPSLPFMVELRNMLRFLQELKNMEMVALTL